MRKLKFSIIGLFFLFGFLACANSGQKGIVIAESKKYEASLFRQNCAICHGAEGEGKTLDDGKIVPSLRSGEHKYKSEAELYRQISEGGNGMTPFRNQLTDREIRLLVDFVRGDLREN